MDATFDRMINLLENAAQPCLTAVCLGLARMQTVYCAGWWVWSIGAFGPMIVYILVPRGIKANMPTVRYLRNAITIGRIERVRQPRLDGI